MSLNGKSLRYPILRLGIASYVAFATEQAQLSSTRESTGQIVGSSVEEVFRLACDALDIDDNERVDQSADVAMAMIAVTPFLRLRMLLPDPMVPNAPASEPLELPRLPHALVVIYLISELARRAGMKRITFQTLSRIEQEFRPLVRLLAYADVPMVWKRGAPIAPEGFDNLEDRTRFLWIARALLPEVQRCQTTRLADILMAHAPRDRVERMLFLKLAAANLLGKLVPLDRVKDHEFKADIRSRMSARIHRWMLYNTDDGSMKTAARLIS
ncbi:MAG TPA: hypothetical protein VGQ52_17760 [Gemmatimonadaceae bacterium]|nr:hypothetical protein [Gemmatimonadaceae bacterium]